VKKILILLAVMSLLGSGCSAVKTLRVVKALRGGSSGQKDFHVVFPYTEKLGLRTLPVKLNGSNTTYSFIFDTGAGATVISGTLAKELNLKKVGSIGVTDALGQSHKQDVVMIEELHVGGLVFHHIGAVVMDYDTLSVIPCIGKDGILGINVISLANWTVDNAQKKFEITDSELPVDVNFTDVLPFTQKAKLPYVSLGVDNHRYAKVLVDMGANSGVTLPLDSFAKNHSLAARRHYMHIDGSTQGLFGNKVDTTYTVEPKDVVLGDIMQRLQYIETSRNTSAKIGNKLWNDYKVGFDFKNQRMLLIRQVDRNTTLQPLSGLGLSLDRKDGKVIISTVFENSPATRAGLQRGDEITAINGRLVSTYYPSYCDFILWAYEEFKNMKEVTLTVAGWPMPVRLYASPYGYMNGRK
jgi:hypothetical protein